MSFVFVHTHTHYTACSKRRVRSKRVLRNDIRYEYPVLRANLYYFYNGLGGRDAGIVTINGRDSRIGKRKNPNKIGRRIHTHIYIRSFRKSPSRYVCSVKPVKLYSKFGTNVDIEIRRSTFCLRNAVRAVRIIRISVRGTDAIEFD